MFCKHDWEKIVDKFIPSNVERLLQDKQVSNFRYLPSDTSATQIIILKCKKCGKLNKTITKT